MRARPSASRRWRSLIVSLTVTRSVEDGGCVAAHPREAGPRERRVAVAAREPVSVHREQRRQNGRLYVGTRGQPRVGRRLRETDISGADVLTYVTPQHPFPYVPPLLCVEVSTVLDGEIGNAAAGVEDVRLGECVRRTGVETAAARSAAIGVEREV